MNVAHKFTGYDRRTEKLEVAFDLPLEHFDELKELAELPCEYLECPGSFPIAPRAASRIASVLQVTIDVDGYDWFVEPFLEQSR